DGNVLGLYRMPDATFFSIDVAVAKARNTAYYADTADLVDADRVDDTGDGVPDDNVPAGAAFTNRTYRFLSEPRYPSGVDGSRPGAFSILLDPGIDPATGENMGPALPASVYSTSDTSVLGFDAFNPGRNFRDPDNIANQNGIVFFPGSAPLYKDGKLIGGFGASGDGVDQDDVVTFSATVGFEVPAALRADQFFVRDVRLPFQKFLRNPRG
ncbi:MAG: heme-binding protein, partial [Planctomycetia bacterium]|nr:heme-binding protein [Planctomycetia bacterium]